MARYIDADKFVKSLEKQSYYSKTNIETRISKMPTADVQPVIHAHWVPQSRLKHILYYLQTGQDFCSCSNCTSCGNKLMRHCPTCGAKMDEEVEDG